MTDLKPSKRAENLLIFKTNIRSRSDLKVIKKVFSKHQSIKDWWVDIDDIDKVMSVEHTNNLSENDVISLVQSAGLNCEVLP